MEHLTDPAAQRDDRRERASSPPTRTVPPAEHISEWADVKLDPIDVERAGALLPDAVSSMQQVGWK